MDGLSYGVRKTARYFYSCCKLNPMNSEELYKESRRIALQKFEVYLDAEYESTERKTEQALRELTKAKREWQLAINNYYRFLDILDRQKSVPLAKAG